MTSGAQRILGLKLKVLIEGLTRQPLWEEPLCLWELGWVWHMHWRLWCGLYWKWDIECLIHWILLVDRREWATWKKLQPILSNPLDFGVDGFKVLSSHWLPQRCRQQEGLLILTSCFKGAEFRIRNFQKLLSPSKDHREIGGWRLKSEAEKGRGAYSRSQTWVKKQEIHSWKFFLKIIRDYFNNNLFYRLRLIMFICFSRKPTD